MSKVTDARVQMTYEERVNGVVQRFVEAWDLTFEQGNDLRNLIKDSFPEPKVVAWRVDYEKPNGRCYALYCIDKDRADMITSVCKSEGDINVRVTELCEVTK